MILNISEVRGACHAGTRNPPRVNTLSTVDPAKPFGLKSVKVNFSSDAAKSFEFQKTG